MRTVIAGGHGKIALRLEHLLTGRGDEVVGLIRNPDQAADLRVYGAEPVLVDLERADAGELAEHLSGADAVVFAAGAGPGSTVRRTQQVDRDGAVLLAEAAEQAGVRRYVMVSSRGADAPAPPGTGEKFAAYLKAKGAANKAVRARETLDWTILRPGRLTDDAGTGTVTLAERTGDGEVTRDDVALTLLGLLDAPGTAGHTLDLVGGSTPVADAVASVAGGRAPARRP